MTTIATPAVAEQCRVTPTVQVVDNRGLAIRILQYNRSAAGEAAELRITRQRYTDSGQLLSSLDPRLAEAQQLDPAVTPNFRYDSSLSGRPLRSLSQDAGTRVRLYDVEGGPLWQTGSRAQRMRWTYDVLHRPSALYEQPTAGEPERVSERYAYADGGGTEAAANSRGRLVAHHDTAGLNETPRYSLTGQLQLSVRRLLQAEVAASDWQGDPSAWEVALDTEAYTSRRGFDALGRPTWSRDARGNRQAQAYSVAGQLTSSQLTLAAQSTAQELLRAVVYSAAGQVQREETDNGVVSEYRYEPQTQRLSRLTVSRPAQSGRSTLLQDLDYRYDPVGNILAISDAAQPVRYHQNQRIDPVRDYQYDALYQLLSASGRENADAGPQGPALPPPDVPISADPNRYSNYTRTYQYDRGGNLTQIRQQGRQHYTLELVVAPTSNRALQQTGFLTPADVDGHFDADGNLLQLAPGQPLAWDGRNQLQQVIQVQRDAGPDDREWYRYDGGGQRVLKTSVSQTSSTERQAEVLYLPGLELRRSRSTLNGVSSTVESLQVIRGQAAGRAQVRVLHWDTGQPADIPNDQVRYSLDDQLGSSLLEVDQAADILTLEEYFPYGGTAVWAGKSLSETQYKFVRYSGKERDATGLYYYGFRYYAPWLGRWLNPDPAGTVDGLNLYRMVGNNPITLYDVDGLMPKKEGASTPKKMSAAALKRSVNRLSQPKQPGEKGEAALRAEDKKSVPTTLVASSSNRVSAAAVSAQTTQSSQASKTKKKSLPATMTSVPPVPDINLATLDIEREAANDDFFDPHLGARLQAYKIKSPNNFTAIQELNHEVDGFKISSRDPRSKVWFKGTYNPDSWGFLFLHREREVAYYGADITMVQYVKVATEKGFFGRLPKVVYHNVITNKDTGSVLQKYKDARNSDSFFDEFINNTPNGKSIQRSLTVFGLEAYKFDESSDFSLKTAVSVRRKK